MSYAEPRQGKSPWFYVGMGCLVLVALGFAGCVAVGFMGYNWVKGVADASNTPLPKEQILANLKDIPPYPNASLVDVPATRVMRAAVGLMTKTGAIESIEVAVFGTKDPYEKVRAFYDTKMKAAGYKPEKESTDLATNSKEWRYSKGDNAALFRYGRMTKEESEANFDKKSQPGPTYEGPTVTIMRFDGIKEGTNLDTFSQGARQPGRPTTGE